MGNVVDIASTGHTLGDNEAAVCGRAAAPPEK